MESGIFLSYDSPGNYDILYRTEQLKNPFIKSFKDFKLINELAFSTKPAESIISFTSSVEEIYFHINFDSTFIYDNNILKKHSNKELFNQEKIENVRFFNNIIYTISNGKGKFWDKNLKEIKKYEFLSENKINNFFIDSEQNTWLSSPKGLSYYMTGESKHIVFENPDPKDDFRSIVDGSK